MIEKYRTEMLTSYRRRALSEDSVKNDFSAPEDSTEYTEPEKAGASAGSAKSAEEKKPFHPPKEDSPAPETSKSPPIPSERLPKPPAKAPDPPGEKEVVPSVKASTQKVLTAEEDDCPPSPSMLRPHDAPVSPPEAAETPVFTAAVPIKDDFPPPPSQLRPPPESTLAQALEGEAILRVHVSDGQSSPVPGADVTISLADDGHELLRETLKTDEQGATQPLSLKAGNPDILCSVEIAADGFCRMRYIRIPLSAGDTLLQKVALIPLPPGENNDFEILYDGLTDALL